MAKEPSTDSDAEALPVCADDTVCNDQDSSLEVLRSAASVNGDIPGAASKLSGYKSSWVAVRVNEADSSAGVPLSLKVTFTANLDSFELYAYVNESDHCSRGELQVHIDGTPSGVIVANERWGEPRARLGDGRDDGKLIVYEIRRTAGECTPADGWKIQFEGAVE